MWPNVFFFNLMSAYKTLDSPGGRAAFLSLSIAAVYKVYSNTLSELKKHFLKNFILDLSDFGSRALPI